MKNYKTFLLALTSMALLTTSSCKKDKTTEETPTTTPATSADKKYVLVIDNGAVSVDVTKPLVFNAHLVSSTGAVVAATGVTWSSNIGGITGSTFKLDKDTTGIVSASISYEGQTYAASVPICVQPLNNTQLFEVVPGAIIWSTNSGDIPLNTVYIGSGSSSYAFSSDDPSIASVSSTGVVSFKKVGNTRIKVTGTIQNQTKIFYVPIMVVGEPEVPLPVTRVVVNPALGEMFRGDNLQLSAKAYNSKGEDVTSTVTFNYLVVPKVEEDEDPNSSTPSPVAISVSSSGKVDAKNIGGAYVQVTANGVMGQSEIIVNPDTVIMVSPFYVQLGGFDFSSGVPVAGPSSQVFTATTYKVDKTIYKNKSGNYLVSIPNPSNLQWDIPLTGVSSIDDLFKVATLSNKSNTSCTATKDAGKTGSTIIIAHSGDLGGGAGIFVMP